MQIVYFTPQNRKREEIFSRNSKELEKRFQRFREYEYKSEEGAEKKTENSGQDPEKKVGQPTDRGTEQAEIEDSAQKLGNEQIQAQASAPPKGTGKKENGADTQPEQQVKSGPEDGSRGIQPKRAEKVIEQAQSSAHTKAQKKGRSLLWGGDNGHPRKRRERNPSRRSVSSS